jgi:type IV pilus assembly protein PilE
MLIIEQETKMNHKVHGFTLLELMITMLVIAILTSIAVPGYRSYMYKSRRADAKAGLSGLQLAQEKYRTSCIQYATARGDSGAYSCVAGNFTLEHSSTSPDQYYNLSITAADASTYTLQASPTGVQADDACGTFTINQNNTKTPEACW